MESKKGKKHWNRKVVKRVQPVWLGPKHQVNQLIWGIESLEVERKKVVSDPTSEKKQETEMVKE